MKPFPSSSSILDSMSCNDIGAQHAFLVSKINYNALHDNFKWLLLNEYKMFLRSEKFIYIIYNIVNQSWAIAVFWFALIS